MNVITFIILSALFFEFTIHLIADILNINNIRESLPAEFLGYYDEEKYKKSQEYLRINTRFGWISGIAGLLMVLGFWFLKGFPQADHYVRSLGYGPVVTGIIFIVSLVILRMLLSLPFSIYSTFVIEEKFGFNKTTPGLFFMDLIKSIVIGIIIGIPILAGILTFFEYAGDMAWLFCWLGATVYTIAIQYIFPVWIMPMFNRFNPVEDGELKKSILSYASSIDFPLKNIYVMDGSRRSNKSNAFFTGFGKNRRIVLYDTLINQHSVPELTAILAHEMGHYKLKHILKGIITSIIHMGFIFYILSVLLSYAGLYNAFFLEERSVYAGLVFFGLLFTPVEFILNIVMQAISRRHEFEADRFAVNTTGNPDAMAGALKKLSVSNLSNLEPHPLYVILNYSHPPVYKRISSISMAAGDTK